MQEPRPLARRGSTSSSRLPRYITLFRSFSRMIGRMIRACGG